MWVRIWLRMYLYMCVYACVRMHLYMHVNISMSMPKFMQEYVFVCERMFVFMLIIVFAVTFCAHVILFDDNLVCFCPAYTLLVQERRRTLGDLPVYMSWFMILRIVQVRKIKNCCCFFSFLMVYFPLT